MKKFIMEACIKGKRIAIKASHPKEPYMFDTQQEAEYKLKNCYPDQMIEQRLSGIPFGRITEIEI
jgi:hypothetical protein